MRWHQAFTLAGCFALIALGEAKGCCAVAESGKPVVNADQTVILWWDRSNQTEHFIRRASFRGGGDSVGFLVPSPARPQLEESGDAAFPYLANITRPVSSRGGFALGCAASMPADANRSVRVIEEKTVAGYDAVVLTAGSGEALLQWLNRNGFAFRPETAAWAEPYVKNGWYISAMKMTKPASGQPLTASALRISFKTDRPLFPYREPDSRSDASQLGIKDRLLRIYFVAESPYQGRYSSGTSWQATRRYSAPLEAEERSRLIQHLGIPESSGPAKTWLSEFEHDWPYGLAPGDVYFEPTAKSIKRSTAGMAFDPTMVIVGAWALLPALWRTARRIVAAKFF